MNPITHYLISWNIAASFNFSKKERICASVSGIIPDIDGIGIVAELISKNTEHQLNWWSDHHHVLGHNLLFSILISLIFLFYTKNILCSAVSFFIFHIHLLCDVIGARGPDGYQWPVNYLFPFSDSFQLAWHRQWALNSWPNMFITMICIFIVFIIVLKKKISPLEIFNDKINRIFIAAVENRFKK